MALLIALACSALLGAPAAASALETSAPHVPTAVDTDVCAMCHRGHSPASGVEYRSAVSSTTTGNALIVGAVTGPADVELCYVCHGVDALGSGNDVQTSFLSTSAHSLAPTASPYGPSAKSCSSCHDSHGSERTASGTPYPALLRSYTVTNALVHSGDEYCATCHLDRVADLWDGLATWRATPHASEITTAVGGTGAVCSVCHEGHGSSVAPLIRTALTSPAVPATVTVGNDRRQCLGCHTVVAATWSGTSVYGASSHGLTPATVTALGEWVSRYPTGSVGTTRTAGECQNCHAAMGRMDASGTLLPKLTLAAGRAVCDRCHDADGPARSNVASTAYAPSAAMELAVVWVPDSRVATLMPRVHIYSRDASVTPPGPLVGPREYLPGAGARTGEAAAGDIDGDGDEDLVVADPGAARLTVFTYDRLRGMTRGTGPGTLGIAFSAEWVDVGDYIADGSMLPEIAVVDTTTATLFVYRYNGAGLTVVSGPHALGALPSGIASGDVTGTAAPDVVVTAYGADTVTYFTQSGASLVAAGVFATRPGPRGPSVGDAWAGGTKMEVAVANSAVGAGTVTIFDERGVQLGSYDATGWAGAYAYDTAIGDVWPGVTPAGTSGNEVLVALYSLTGGTGFNVFPQVAAPGGLGARQGYALDRFSGAGALAAADVDGDGRAEAIVGSSGKFAPAAVNPTATPSVDVYRADSAGTTFTAPRTRLFAGGTEFSGQPPALVFAQLGDVGPTRHPVDAAAAGSHISTETVTAARPRHVGCADCHNSHEATSTAASAPRAYGRILGAWGVAVTNTGADGAYSTAQLAGVVNEYELCFKCHSAKGSVALGEGRDVASEVNTRNPGAHAVESSATTAQLAGAVTYVGGWAGNSVLYCTSCHGRSRSTVTSGLHESTQTPLLKWPYLGSLPSDTGQLCYRCHNQAVYYTGASDGAGASRFYRQPPTTKEHYRHVQMRGVGCQGCHVSHGSATTPHLLRSDVGWAPLTGLDIGQCTNPCHAGTARAYRP